MAGKRVAESTQTEKERMDEIAREDREFYYRNQEPDERGWY